MQTFLPYPDFLESAMVLDYRRLGKQRVECIQIYNAITTPPKHRGWHNHPASVMWRGYEDALAWYMDNVIRAWKMRGYQNVMRVPKYNPKCLLPPWIGDPVFHASHRSNLLRKDPDWYGQWGWEEPDNLPYIWPKNDILLS